MTSLRMPEQRVTKHTADQPIVKGADVIYAPAGQAGEYAPLATNPYRGCGHACAYCYVPLVTKQARPDFDAGAVERAGFEKRLIADARRYEAAGVTDQVMLSFTTDPYHPGDCSLTAATLEVLKSHGLGFCTLTKGGTKAWQDVHRFRPDRDAFASKWTKGEWIGGLARWEIAIARSITRSRSHGSWTKPSPWRCSTRRSASE
jgi:hypothetical protein